MVCRQMRWTENGWQPAGCERPGAGWGAGHDCPSSGEHISRRPLTPKPGCSHPLRVGGSLDRGRRQDRRGAGGCVSGGQGLCSGLCDQGKSGPLWASASPSGPVTGLGTPQRKALQLRLTRVFEPCLIQAWQDLGPRRSLASPQTSVFLSCPPRWPGESEKWTRSRQRPQEPQY